MRLSFSRVEPGQGGPGHNHREEREMTTIQAPQVDAELPASTIIDLGPEFPVGLGTTEPDDLGAWWLDLGCVGLPADLAV